MPDDTQIDLRQTVAALRQELEATRAERDEAMAREAAIAEVLRVISRSVFDLDAVLQAVVTTAVQLCRGQYGVIFRNHGNEYRFAAGFGNSPEYEEHERQSVIRPGYGTIIGRAALEGRAVQIADALTDPDYEDKEGARLNDAHTMLGVPLLRDGAVVGALGLARNRVEPFSDKEITLVSTFADQAVIAIENTRLLTELRESLEQQQAITEVLQVINSSPGDLAPVFEAILENSHRLCGIDFGALQLQDGGKFRSVAARGLSEMLAELLRRPFEPVPGSPPSRLLGGERIVHIADMAELARGRAADARAQAVAKDGFRTGLFVPLRKDANLLGYIVALRREVRFYSGKEIALLQNFAAQAVIAMENARLLTETREALEQQTATAEVLQVINSSPGDLAPVFEAMVERAVRLCEADEAVVRTFDGKLLHLVAAHGEPGIFAKLNALGPSDVSRRGGMYDFLTRGESVSCVADVRETAAYRENPRGRARLDARYVRSWLAVALRKEDALLGIINVHRHEVRPFTDKQIALLQNFAAQAVIAMENARLLTETREALEQQTATAEVLQVINSSPGELAPVFDAILEKAHALCGVGHGALIIYDGELFRARATRGLPERIDEFLRRGFALIPGAPVERLVRGEPFVQILDMAALAAESPPEIARFIQPAVDSGGRTVLTVALRKDSALLGYIAAARLEVQAFSEKEIALLQNFAAQAVIAMENARLLTETREALEQQTATAEVLQVINSSPGDLAPVFEAMLEKATHLCEANFGVLCTYDGACYWATTLREVPDAYAEFLTAGPLRPGPGNGLARVATGEKVVHVLDVAAEDIYRSGEPLRRALVDLGGARTVLTVALLKDEALLGAFIIYRQEVRSFTDTQIALVQNFAAQAVIAMENARLINEIRQRQAELRVTFDNMGDGVVMFDEDLRLAAWNRNFQQLIDLPDAILAGRPSYAEYLRILAERGEFGSGDIEGELNRRLAETDQELRLERTRPDGRVIEVRRNAVPGGGFVLIYSDITERKRAEAEIRAARDAAEKALAELKTAQASLIHAEKMASLGQLTAGIAHEIKNPLNFVNNFAGLSVELLDELKEMAEPGFAALDSDTREEVDETIDMLSGNLDKIVEHGRRADGIVQSMLLHSRGGSGERRSVDLNALVDEALSLAYHGARAQDQSFNITLEREFAKPLAPIELVPQDMTRVFLNLIGNGFHAAQQRRKTANDPGFSPVLKVATRDLGDAVEVGVRDNGTGILPEHRDRLFQPFFTTKPTGQGTGLGLSISYDIVTQEHGGTIEVDSEPGVYAEFKVRLPRSSNGRSG
ncbi:MAG: GAF domain-containing protein [Alphaproteobacteria bacterium]|nr:GAF domain-containing protein [Alphaproteobacteria bacterium]